MASEGILVGRGDTPLRLLLSQANRHGLITGATGTGKTVTLQVLAEGFSAAGVPVFCADVKGDLAGLAQPGAANAKLERRAAELGMTDYGYRAAPVVFWDLFGTAGHPVRATVAEMGPLLLARILELNDTQEGVLQIAFALADDEGLLLLDFKDLRAILTHVGDRAEELGRHYGNVSKATVGTIQRKLLQLEQDGADHFFGEPALELSDLMLLAPDGSGAVNILAADRLINSPRLYATFLLWLLSELFEELPEVGDLARPKLVFFFDEAHLLFRDAPKALIEKVERVVRLIRSKGVGVYFVTQNPLDVPQSVLGQLGNRVQHALRAFTPADQKAVRAAAETFRPNPRLKVEQVIGELGTGEALVSLLDAEGKPAMVERARICPPRSRLGAISAEERSALLARSPVAGRYDTPVDRDSAYERLQGRATSVAEAPEPHPASAAATVSGDPWGGGEAAPAGPWRGGVWNQPPGGPAPRPPAPGRRAATPRAAEEQGIGSVVGGILMGDGRRQGVAEALAKSVVRSVGSQVGRQIGSAVLRGVLGSILKR